MFVKQFVEEGLGNSSYLVGSENTGVAVVIDPIRDAEIYAREAGNRELRITHVLETHLHADFVSGSREVAARTGAIIGASAASDLQFDHMPLRNGDRIESADLLFQVVETPGHTPEHISFLAIEPETGRPLALFSGGALIVGGAARTDLLGPDQVDSLTKELYHTIKERIEPLPDDLVVCPTHGAGSFCAAPSQNERTTTIGNERLHNPLIQARSEEEFRDRALKNLSSYPSYFKWMTSINRRGPRVLGGIPSLRPLTPREAKDRLDAGAVVIDTRPGPAFAAAHIPGSFGVPLRSSFSTWVGWVVPPGRPVIIVSADPEHHRGIARQLVMVGYDDLAGYLEGGVAAWGGEAGFPVASDEVLSVSELRERLQSPNPPVVLDVRQDSEWRQGHIPGAVHIEGGRLAEEADRLPHDRPIAVHCGTHNRSPSAMSVLERQGFKDVLLVRGGWTAWAKAGYNIEIPDLPGKGERNDKKE